MSEEDFIDTSGVVCDEDGNVIDTDIEYDINSDDSVEDGNILRENLPTPSDEQNEIINAMCENHVLVDSVAGCGKTTTIIHAALKYPDKSFLILMYNKRLKEETKIKMKSLKLMNVEVQNFHSFFVRYYSGENHTDLGLKTTINKNTPPNFCFYYDYIIIDEAQDMKAIFYFAIKKILADQQIQKVENANEKESTKENEKENEKEKKIIKTKLVILGDRYQNVYKFLGSDERFLLFAPKIYSLANVDDAPWVEKKLSISYRLTKETASFINNAVLKYERIKAVSSGPLVKYVICNLFSSPLKQVKEAIELYGYENIFIVSNSVKSAKSPLRHIANKLSEKKIPIFVPNSDDAEIDSKVIKGKLVFTTYNQTKGLERDCVFVFNIDEWNPDNTENCPNAVYVAMTRAKKQLVLFHSNKSKFSNFIDPIKAKQYGNMQIIGKFEPAKNVQKPNTKKVAVTELVEYLTSEVLEKACSYFSFTESNDNCPRVSITTTIPSSLDKENLFEDVSDITGVAIPTYYEYLTKKQAQIYTHMSVKARLSIQEPKINELTTPTGIEKLLHMCNVYIANDSGYMHKLAQVQKYDWLNPNQLKLLQPRLEKHITNPFKSEYEYKVFDTVLGYDISGSIDCMVPSKTSLRIYEFKCVNLLKRSHLIQLASYAFLYENELEKKKDKKSTESCLPRKYILLNLLSGCYYIIKFNIDDLREMVEYLIYNKFYLKKEKDDKTFMKEIGF